MKLNKEKIRNNDQQALLELHRAAKNCAKIGAASVKAYEFADDIAQEVMMLVLSKMDQYDPEREIEPFMIEASKLIGKTMLRKHSREILAGSEDDSDQGIRLEEFEDKNSLSAEEIIDMEREEMLSMAEILISKFSQSLERQEAAEAADSASPLQQTPPAPPSFKHPEDEQARPAKRKKSRKADTSAPDWDEIDAPPPPKGKRQKRTLGPKAARFREIRKKICYTHRWMATALGVEIGTIHAIEYGLSEPTDEMLDKAEEMLSRMQASTPKLLASDPRMIAADWMRRLGLHDEDYSGLARIVGVNRSTAFRWLRGEYMPTPKKLWAIEILVQLKEEERNKIIEAIPKIA